MVKEKEGVKFWNESLIGIFSYLGTSEHGLSNNEANSRISKYSYNEIPNESRRVTLNILIDQFKNPLIFILIVASIVAYLLGEKIGSMVILAIVLLYCVTVEIAKKRFFKGVDI